MFANSPTNTPNEQAIISTFGSVEKFRQQFDMLSANLSQNGTTPEALVQSLLDSGKMSQEQFVQFSNAANRILGRR